MVNKIVCIGDSMTLPGHHNRYEDTWIYLLKKSFPAIDFITFFARGATTEILNTTGGGNDGIDNKPRGADLLEFYEPEMVIMQIGLVDCAPRVMNRNLLFYKLLVRQPRAIQDNVWKVIKKFKKRDADTVDVKLEDFQANLEKYIQRALAINVKKIIMVRICTPDERVTTKSPSFLDNINRYNAVLDELGKKFADLIVFIDPLNERAIKEHGVIYQDGYHTNAKGNALVHAALADVLKKEIY
jgi:acyl-CoA thioesterase-1